VVGEAADNGELMTQVEAGRPDLVLLDEDLPGGPMSETISALRRLGFPLAVIAISGRLESEQAALAAGADAFVSKGDPPKRLLIAIESIRLRGDYEK
jgi:DNA-binding NarL/FixJ family response regulator